jgi:succinate dehydrogenase/fumarate reductase-like Fe-S protein
MRGYRGLLREFSRTGTLRALSLQIRTGIAHIARRARGGMQAGDPVARFLESYGPDGLRRPDPQGSELLLASEACLVCGLCSAECARVEGRPALDPRDAVIAAARLEIDLIRFDLARELEFGCYDCAACDAVCPVEIPIHRVQQRLAELTAPEEAPLC